MTSTTKGRAGQADQANCEVSTSVKPSKSRVFKRTDWVRNRAVDMKSVRDRFGLTREEMANLLGLSEIEFRQVEQGQVHLRFRPRRKARELQELGHELEGVMKASAIKDWLLRPLPVLGDEKPITVIKRGDEKIIRELVLQVNSDAAN